MLQTDPLSQCVSIKSEIYIILQRFYLKPFLFHTQFPLFTSKLFIVVMMADGL